MVTCPATRGPLEYLSSVTLTVEVRVPVRKLENDKKFYLNLVQSLITIDYYLSWVTWVGLPLSKWEIPLLLKLPTR